MNICYETNSDIHMAWLQISSTTISYGLPNMAMQLFNRPTRGILPKFSRPPILSDDDKNSHNSPVNRQPHVYVDVDAHKIFTLCLYDEL